MKRNKPKQSRFDFSSEKVSPIELARFLRGLANFYRDPQWGNAPLAKALHEVARNLTSQRESAKRPARPQTRRKIAPLLSMDKWRFDGFDASEVTRFLNDLNNSKLDLIELAAIRFGIPRSKLMKLRTEEVRDRIRAALLHEDSLHIISEEARRGGAKRSS